MLVFGLFKTEIKLFARQYFYTINDIEHLHESWYLKKTLQIHPLHFDQPVSMIYTSKVSNQFYLFNNNTI